MPIEAIKYQEEVTYKEGDVVYFPKLGYMSLTEHNFHHNNSRCVVCALGLEIGIGCKGYKGREEVGCTNHTYWRTPRELLHCVMYYYTKHTLVKAGNDLYQAVPLLAEINCNSCEYNGCHHRSELKCPFLANVMIFKKVVPPDCTKLFIKLENNRGELVKEGR